MRISARAGDELLEVTVERREGLYEVEVNGTRRTVDVQKLEGEFFSLLTDGRSYEVSVEPYGGGYLVRHGAAAQLVSFTDPGRRAREGARAADGPEKIVSMMPGKVVRLLVGEGDRVESGAGLVVIEAMKMENEIAAPRPGVVRSIGVEPGQTVEGGAVLMVIE